MTTHDALLPAVVHLPASAARPRRRGDRVVGGCRNAPSRDWHEASDRRCLSGWSQSGDSGHQRTVGSFRSCPVFVAHQLSALVAAVRGEAEQPPEPFALLRAGPLQWRFLCSTRKPVSSSRPMACRRPRVETRSRLAVASVVQRAPAPAGHALTAARTRPGWPGSGRRSGGPLDRSGKGSADRAIRPGCRRDRHVPSRVP